jgi:PAS domain S-box-containing protein
MMMRVWQQAILRWAVIFLVFSGTNYAQPQPDPLTAEERAWLAAHPVLYLAPDPAYEPIEFFDEQNVFRGISADYVALIEQRLGLRFQVVNRRTVQAEWDAGRVRVDVMPTCMATPERAQTWSFTTPYLEFPTYLITKKNVTAALTLKQLKGSRVAVVANYGAREYLATQHPELILDPVPDTRTGLQKVSFGLVDAFVSDLPVATYWMEREGITNLKALGEVGYVYKLGFGVPSDRRPLDSILEKSLALITPEERAAIYHKWVKLSAEPSPFNRRLALMLLGGLGVAGVGMLFVLWWNRSLAAKVKERTAALQQELSERKQAEERFAKIFRSSPNALAIARFADGVIVDVNDSWGQMTGYAKEDFIGRRSDETELWHKGARRDEIIHALVQRRKLRDWEVEYQTKTGERRIGNLSIEVLRLNGELCHLWSVLDLTDRKRAEEALQQSEALFRSLTESTTAWVYVFQNRRLCYVNEAAERGMGYAREELLALTFEQLVHPDELAWHKERIAAHRAGREVPTNFEARALTKTGEVRWLAVATKPIEYQGAPATLNTAFDITDRKRAEEQLKISEQQLHQLAGYLQTIREEERTSIAREIHDELGQAMTAMKMDLSWLTKRVPEDQTPIQERLKGMIELVSDTITTVRRLATQLRPGILDDLGLQAALEWQAQEFQTRTGIGCDFVAEADVSALAPERATAIFRICQEALTNVARHAEATQVHIRLWEGQQQLRLEVQDNGRGISTSETAHPRSFGLLGMQERAFLLGGEFQLTGRPNQGTTVTARIPRYQSIAKGGAS